MHCICTPHEAAARSLHWGSPQQPGRHPREPAQRAPKVETCTRHGAESPLPLGTAHRQGCFDTAGPPSAKLVFDTNRKSLCPERRSESHRGSWLLASTCRVGENKQHTRVGPFCGSNREWNKDAIMFRLFTSPTKSLAHLSPPFAVLSQSVFSISTFYHFKPVRHSRWKNASSDPGSTYCTVDAMYVTSRPVPSRNPV